MRAPAEGPNCVVPLWLLLCARFCARPRVPKMRRSVAVAVARSVAVAVARARGQPTTRRQCSRPPAPGQQQMDDDRLVEAADCQRSEASGNQQPAPCRRLGCRPQHPKAARHIGRNLKTWRGRVGFCRRGAPIGLEPKWPRTRRAHGRQGITARISAPRPLGATASPSWDR